MMRGYEWGSGGAGWGGWVFMALMMLIFFALVVAAVIALVRTSARGTDRSPRHEGGGTDTALRLLDERFARGEIDADEYTQRRDLLRSR